MKPLTCLPLLSVLALVCAPPLLIATESPALNLARQLNQAFVEVAERVSPSVVVINVVQKPANPKWDEEEDPSDRFPNEFWRRFHEQFDGTPRDNTRGQGSGIIIREDGFILTNGHVVEDAERIQVRLQDGRRFEAKVRGTDRQSDVAVIKIEATGLLAAKLADSARVRVGEFAIAIGAPFELDYSVTFGHVSAKGRSRVLYDPSMDQDFIQTDANINPGNSGGPLVNINGEVIGMNTLIRGVHTGIGFAIPSNLAKEVADQLIARGKFTRAWLGIGIRTLQEDAESRTLMMGVDDGVIVASIVPNGPAARSDLQTNDVITAVDDRRVSTAQQLKDEIRQKPVGQPVTLAVVRNGKDLRVKVRPGEWGEEQVMASARRNVARTTDASGLGLTVQALTGDLAEKYAVKMREGVIVTAVEKGSLAARQGIRPGDIITEVSQQPVTTPAHFREALKKADIKKGVSLNLIRADASRSEVLKEAE